jgi:hypothetical protein
MADVATLSENPFRPHAVPHFGRAAIRRRVLAVAEQILAGQGSVSTDQEESANMHHVAADSHDRTRHTLHRIANHVLARAQHSATGELGLRATPGGFGTISIRPDRERIRISGVTLVRESTAPNGTWTRSIDIAGATLGELAAFADVDLTAEFWAGHDTPPVGDVDEPLDLDAAAARRIGDWYAVVSQALDQLVHSAPAYGAPSLVQLWPEHFDAALDIAFDAAEPEARRVNMGGSPGDGFHAAPYVYVGPWTPERPGDATFWNAPFGSVLGYDTVMAAPDPVDAAFAFFRTGLERLTG